ncbi:RDD family protein [Halopseudomonas maritima]|uniref:RDD family protein n=1 Tax=Halopseudomonas maritima TaxID=2918528 RepID=UPI001EECF044|nr:RDD family protein [Halopseudomonas maritima]UJJ33262.1 RDD family protein [Halopseudomonas maritima]
MSEPQYAGFWLRFGATIIDSVIFGLVLMVPLTLIYGERYWIDETMVHGAWDVLLSYVVPFIATLWFWRRFLGTPGKMLLRLRVVDARSGEPLPLGQCVLRYIGYFVSALPLCLGFLWVAFDSRKQAWHDKIGGSVVIVEPREPVRFEGRE